MVRFLSFMAAVVLAWWWLHWSGLRLFSQRVDFHAALHPKFGEGDKYTAAWPDGFWLIQLKDVRRAIAAAKPRRYVG